MRRYAVCYKCNEVINYEVSGEWTSFPRGEYLVHQDYIVTGIETHAEAKKTLKDDPYHIREKMEANP